MGKITNLGPTHSFGRSHFPHTFGFSGSRQGGAKTSPAMPAPRSGPATAMAGDGKHGGGFPMGPTGQLGNPSAMPGGAGAAPMLARGGRVQKYAKGGAVKAKFGGGTAEESAVQEAAEERADEKEDKHLVKKGVGQHEDQLHGGKKSTLKLAKGGVVRGLRLRGAKKRSAPKASRAGEAVNRPPQNPMNEDTPAEPMAGGVMPYGTEPGTEADPAGSTQGIPQLKGGGKVKRK